MAGEDGIEILDSNVSTTSSAITHQMDKKNLQVAADAPTAVAGTDQEVSNVTSAGGDGSPQQVLAAVGMEATDDGAAAEEVKEEAGPFDEEGGGARGAPISHVQPAYDDVSSLQHTNQGEKSTGYIHQGQPYDGPADAPIEEGDEYYNNEEAAHQKAIQRRNMLIIIMLIIFLGLVVAISVGVGLAVKNNNSNPDSAEDPSTLGGSTTDDEYGNIGGGLDVDDQFQSEVPSSAPSNEGPCYSIEIGIIFDQYTDETGWMLVKGNYYPEDDEKNNVVWKSKHYKPTDYAGRADTFTKCFGGGYYTWVFTDKESDGLCCYHGEGSFVLSSEGKVITIGGEMDTDEESVVFELPFVEPEPIDVNNDGNDDRLGWVMPYDSSNLIEGETCENFRMVILTDEYGIETTWELYEGKDKSGTLIANGGPYGSEYTYVVEYCLASPQEYALYMYDWDRRGLCCESGEGWYTVTSGDVVIVEKNGKFGEENVTTFVLPADGSVDALFSDAPTPAPTEFVPAVKTAYPTVTPPTPPPTPPPMAGLPTEFDNLSIPQPTVDAFDKLFTPFPTPLAQGPSKRRNEKE